MTVLELIERASARLDQAGVSFGQGTTNAFDEAAWLVLWRLNVPLDALDDVAERALDEPTVASVDALIARRIESRRPAAYLTGEAWLQGVPFTIDERSIVPRSLIAEVLADGTLDAWLHGPPARVLDLCTGNGSLAVLCALRWPAASVDGSDIAADALNLARLNVERHDLTDRVTLHAGDGFAALRDRYDLIVCNPPYVNATSMAALPPEFQCEPALALAGGDDGMDLVRRVLRDAAAHLQPHGLLVLEIGHERAHFDAAFPALEVASLPTSEGDDAVLLITRETLERG
jgi:ribosomal protein L3 glutamine methyltransferase